MAHILKPRVAETSTSTGTGAFTLAGALTGYQSFASAMATSDTTEYVIVAVDSSGNPTGDWEEGFGTYSGTNTLTRTTVSASSNAGSAVTFAAGDKLVLMTPQASRVGGIPRSTAIFKGDGSGALTAATAGTDYVIPSALNSYLPLAGGTMTGNLTFSGTSRRIIGDFNNATHASRTLFQGSAANGNTQVGAIPNGSSTQSGFFGYNSSSPANSSTVGLTINSTEAALASAIQGSGSYLPLLLQTGGSTRATLGALGGFEVDTGLLETRIAMGANDIDLRAGNYFTKTFTATTFTLTASNVPASGTAASFILDATNGGLATISFGTGFTSVKWVGGAQPTLTSAGRDVLGFFTHDGGTTWTGLLLGKDVK